MAPYVIALFIAFVLSVALTPASMALARRINFMDRPNTALKKHRAPVPYLGGLAVFFAFAAAALSVKLTYFPASNFAPWPFDLQLLRGVYAILAGALAALALGLVDDKKALSPAVKFIGQVFGALVLVACGIHVRFVEHELLSKVLTVFWVVAVTNALNFVDIMDGLAAGVSGIASLGFFLFAFNAGRFNDALLAAALGGACFGFLAYNFAPAKIYLGDAGSHFLGFALAAISLNLSYSHTNHLAVFSPLLILGLPLFDLLLMTVIRTRKGIPPWKGSPDHIPLRLRALGLTKVQTVLLLYGATALLCAIAWYASLLSMRSALLAWAGLGIAAVFLGEWLMGIEMPKKAA